jgi:hypothetical protein
VNYVRHRPGRDRDGKEREFFGADHDLVPDHEVKEAISRQGRAGVTIHRMILSPGVAGADVQDYTRDVMQQLASRKGIDLEWYGVVHNNTDNPHCHVVLMGKGRDGRYVKMSKEDLGAARQYGDKHLEKHRLVEKEREPGRGDPWSLLVSKEQREAAGKFLSALKAGVKEFNKEYSRVMAGGKKEEKPPEKQPTAREREEGALGKVPTFDEFLVKRIDRDERARAKEDKKWKKYYQPVYVDYCKDSDYEGLLPVKYDRTCDIGTLRGLTRERHEGEPAAMAIPKEDMARVREWIVEKEKDSKQLDREAAKVKDITVRIAGRAETRLSVFSSLEEMKEFKRLDGRNDIYLTEPERRALNAWIEDKAEGRMPSLSDKDSRERKKPTADKELLDKRQLEGYQKEGKQIDRQEQLAETDRLKAQKENLQKQRTELSKIERERPTVDGQYTEKWGASKSALAAGPMGATSGGLRDLGPNEALRLIKIGISDAKVRKEQKEEVARAGKSQLDLAEKNKGLVDNKVTTELKVPPKPESKLASKTDPQPEPKKEAPTTQSPERGEQQKLSKEAESFLREIEERKQKERDRDPNRDPGSFDEWIK